MNHALASGPALIEAAENGDTRMLRHCLLMGVKPTARNQEGVPALSTAARHNRLQSAVLLTAQRLGEKNEELRKVLDAKSREIETLGWTALHVAASRGHVDMVGFLLNRGSSVDVQDQEGVTALMLACKKNNSQMCAMLLEARANTEVKDKEGMSAMHYAGRYGDTELIDLLLKGGAFTLVKDEKEKDPSDHAYDVAHDIRKTNQLKGGHNRTVTDQQLLNWHYDQYMTNSESTRHMWIDSHPGKKESSPARKARVKKILRQREIEKMMKKTEHEQGGLRAAQAAVRMAGALTHGDGGSGGSGGGGGGGGSGGSEHAWQGSSAANEQWQAEGDIGSAAAWQGWEGDCWTEAWDECSGAKYYYNTQTGESRWEPPEEWGSESPAGGGW
jgi:hypothetical protein